MGGGHFLRSFSQREPPSGKAVITTNAMWIGYDVDKNPSDALPAAPPFFQAAIGSGQLRACVGYVGGVCPRGAGSGLKALLWTLGFG